MLSASVTNPADFLKTRIMTSKNNKINITNLIKNIIKQEGYGAFSTGIIYRTIYTGIANGIFFTYYELIRNNYYNLKK